MKEKKYVLLISSIIGSLALLSILLFMVFYQDKELSEKAIYGTVLEKGSNYIKIEADDKELYYINGGFDSEVGDLVLVNYEDEEDLTKGTASIDVILKKDEEIIIVEDDEDNLTVTSSVPVVESTTTKITSEIIKSVNEEEIVSYFEEQYETINTANNMANNTESFKEKAKSTFITFVDFIFYDGEIKGVKFKELSSSAKAKVIYYTLLLDAKIEDKWPNYKENLSTKYQDIKAKLIAKYFDLTTSICENNQENCANVQEDFNLLKKSLNLTWNTIKEAFVYAFNKGKTSIINWYEIFSGKI